MPTLIVRTYANATVVIDRHDESGDYQSRWSGYTPEEAAATALHLCNNGGSATVEVHTWDVEIDPAKAHIYRPGIAERIVEVV